MLGGMRWLLNRWQLNRQPQASAPVRPGTDPAAAGPAGIRRPSRPRRRPARGPSRLHDPDQMTNKRRGRFSGHVSKMNPVLQKDLLALLRLKRVAAVQIALRRGAGGDGAGQAGRSRACLKGVREHRRRGQRRCARRSLSAGPDARADRAAGAVRPRRRRRRGQRRARAEHARDALRLAPDAREIIAGKVGVAIGYPLLLLADGAAVRRAAELARRRARHAICCGRTSSCW